ncbi:WD repeat-containing protein 4 [Borealophlyctis nickersoniae]|nr:WD repeat-containing protein 4 [Borealophlyctis nickersoniae]
MITDMIMSENGRYIITADRDEKIRVSNYPLAFDLESFCLGHEEFVSAIHLLPENTLVSSGGDPFLLVWDFMKGEILQKIQLPTEDASEDNHVAVSAIRSHTPSSTVAVLQEGKPFVLFYNATNPKDLQFKQRVALDRAAMDMAFDRAGNLWVGLEPGEGRLVDVLRVSAEQTYSQAAADSLVEEVNRIATTKIQKLPELSAIRNLRKGLGLASNDWFKKKKRKGEAAEGNQKGGHLERGGDVKVEGEPRVQGKEKRQKTGDA